MPSRWKPTRPDKVAHHAARRVRLILEFAAHQALPDELHWLLAAVVDGHRGEGLRAAIEADDLDALERAFAAHTGTSVYRAAADILRESSLQRPELEYTA